MKCNLLILFVIILIILIIIFYNYILYVNNKNVAYKSKNNNNRLITERFLTENNSPDNDGKLIFSYLNDPQYTNNILSKYYIYDDTRMHNYRLIYHPNQYFRYASNNLVKYYGNVNNVDSNKIYKEYNIRL